MKNVLGVLVVMLAAGCGPAEGEACAPVNAAKCDGTAAAFFCESDNAGGGVFRRFACPGGCSELTGAQSGVMCSTSGTVEGAPCPGVFVDQTTCDAASAQRVLMCMSAHAATGAGTWALSEDCRADGGTGSCTQRADVGRGASCL